MTEVPLEQTLLTIELPRDIVLEIEAQAVSEHRARDEVFIEILKFGFGAKKQRKKRNGLIKLASIGITGGPADLAIKLDDYLCGSRV